MNRMDWKKAARNPRGHERAEPRGAVAPIQGQQHVKRQPVKTWAQMTDAERASVLASITKERP